MDEPATAPPASPDGGAVPVAGGQRAEPSVLVFVKDNLEAFAVAVIMALVIKHFCVEAFKIPTGSMVPTLYGDNYDPDRDGDRILVDKWAYLFREPERWDIPVFRYPLDRSRNFIKRIVGIPGELLRIHGGDIWTRRRGSDDEFEIARKPQRVRDQLFFRVYPPAEEGQQGDDAALRDSLEETWRIEGPEGVWRLHDHERYEFLGGPAASLVTKHTIHADSDEWDWPRPYYSDDLVRDVRVRATIERGPARPAELDLDEPDHVELSWKPDGDWETVLVLSALDGRSFAELRRDGRALEHVPLPVTLAPKASVSAVLEYVDGDLRVSIDGIEHCVLPDRRRIGDASGRAGQALTISATGSPYVIGGLEIHRDLYYENRFAYRSEWQREGVEIPDGAYFMLGDNTSQSSDSRKWRIRTLYLKDRPPIQYDDGPGHGPDWLDGGVKRVVDVDGVTRTWHEDDEDPDRGGSAENAPFVWRELIVGRAFLVFWPLSPEFPGRLRFIH